MVQERRWGEVDTVSAIVAAIAAAVVARRMGVTAKAVEDSYDGLQALLAQRYVGIDLKPVEARPESRPKRESLAEDLTDRGGSDDDELVAQAHALLEALRREDPAAGRVIGVDLKEVNAAFLAFHSVRTRDADVTRVRDKERRPAAPRRSSRATQSPSSVSFW